MRPLTDTTPKPLLSIQGVPLLSYHLRALQLAGHTDVAINTAWLEEKITQHYGEYFCEVSGLPPVRIHYSREGRDFGYALETAWTQCFGRSLGIFSYRVLSFRQPFGIVSLGPNIWHIYF